MFSLFDCLRLQSQGRDLAVLDMLDNCIWYDFIQPYAFFFSSSCLSSVSPPISCVLVFALRKKGTDFYHAILSLLLFFCYSFFLASFMSSLLFSIHRLFFNYTRQVTLFDLLYLISIWCPSAQCTYDASIPILYIYLYTFQEGVFLCDLGWIAFGKSMISCMSFRPTYAELP